ncbi:hypothetical protein GPECTOR_1g343 [Gonium pectorale]|uniref:J domain-containing protein n=1 Tax=Gonium pectorale TaxID=33097 RepID=A0A150H2I4_GONPE|nr:hypothetical protein GPECTOR_1g343 [Gonium pectorale]|eukprot:KXZ56387.1 hypothetical protein GPECTOR_1g343 [Gonium pectorale]
MLSALALLELDQQQAAPQQQQQQQQANWQRQPDRAALLACLRRAYRSAARRWHPDKSAAVLAALPAADRDATRQRLLGLCQELNRQHEALERQLARRS